MNFADPFVRRSCQVVLILVAVLLLIAGLIPLLVALDFEYWTTSPGSTAITAMARALPKLQGDKTSELLGLLAIFANALPLIAVTVALDTQPQTQARIFNATGKGLVVLFALTVLVSIPAFLMIDVAGWGPGHLLDGKGLANTQEWARAALRASLFYLAVLFGLRAAK